MDVKISGVGEIVKIGECKFGKKKYNRRVRRDGQWMFGGIERENE